MELGAAERVELPYYTIKVHRLMCLELKKLIDSISHMFSDIESTRPCTLGMQALCSLQLAMDKAKLLIQHCSESSKLYLAITAKAILSRCDKIRKTLVHSMNQVRDMVPPLLAEKISRILDELRSARFSLEPSEYEAGSVILGLLQQDTSASDSKRQSEIEALQLAALRLNILTPFALLTEKSSIRKLLGKVHDRETNKRNLLNYLLYLLRKHGKSIWQQESKPISPPEVENNLSSLEKKQGIGKEEDETPPNDFFIPKPPEEFKCPISMRLLYDPVIIASGKTFERVWIEQWFNEGNQTCPATNTRMEQLSIIPNLSMKGLISKWCLRHGINIPEHAKPIPSLPSLSEPSLSSIASFGSSVLRLQIQIGSVSLGSMSTDSSLDSSDRTCNDEVAADSHSQRCLLPSKTSSGHDIDAAFLSELDERSWNSQCKAVENVKGLLEDNDKARHLTFSSSHVNPVIKFLKAASEICDIKRQKDGAEVLLAILRSSRIELPPCDEDVTYFLASLLDSELAPECLAIMEVLSWQQYYKSRIVASGVLPSILKVLDTRVTESYTLAMKILRNLSDCSDVNYHIAYLGYIPKLVSFLEDPNVAGYCIEIINNICNIEEARIEATESNLFTSIARLLEDGKEKEQEVAVDVLLSLCYEDTGYCQVIMAGSIKQSLHSISRNGSSRASDNALLLIELLEHMTRSDASHCSISSFILSQENSHVSSCSDSKSSSAFGYLRKKVLRFLHAKW